MHDQALLDSSLELLTNVIVKSKVDIVSHATPFSRKGVALKEEWTVACRQPKV